MDKKVEFKVGDETLRGSLFVPSGNGPFPGVICLHGSGGVGEMYFEIAEKLGEKGIAGLAFNYRGTGISDGKFEDQSVLDGIKDTRAAFNFLISRDFIDKERIGVIGGSFGGFLAALLSNELDLKSIVLTAPSAYSPKRHHEQRDAGSQHDDFKESDSYREIAKFKGNLLVIKHEFDEEIFPGMVEGYFEQAKSAKKEWYILKGAKHRVSIYPEIRAVLVNRVVDWFLKTL